MDQFFGDLSHLGATARPWTDYNFKPWPAGFVLERHAHSFLQVIHVLAGDFAADWGAGWVELAAGEVHVLPPGGSHRLRTTGGHRQFGLNFTVESDERGLLAACRARFAAPVVLRLDFRPEWEKELIELRPDGGLPTLRLLHVLAAYTLALLAAGDRGAPRRLEERLLAMLAEEAGQPLRVEELARRLNLSRASLQRFCHKRFGLGAAHLHERLRLRRAAQVLARPENSVADCAALCGYADLYHFSRAFKRVFGLSPSAYRRERESGRA